MAGKDGELQRQASNIVAVVAVIGLVVLNIFQPDAPAFVSYGLIGTALGAKIDDLKDVKWRR